VYISHCYIAASFVNVPRVFACTRINDMHSSNTCDMYMCRLRHIHDPVLLSLKMEGIRLLFLSCKANARVKLAKDGARPALFHISCCLCCWFVICVVRCNVYV
jgi:hypothetical protein